MVSRMFLVSGLAVSAVLMTLSPQGASAQGSGTQTTTAVKGEFGSSCATGLMEGKKHATDCSVNWTAADGKIYCFGNDAAKEIFLKDPESNVRKAAEGFEKIKAAPVTGSLVRKEFTEEDATKALEAVIAERTKDGVFVFRDPKLDQDLQLVFDNIRIVRGMRGYGWFPNVIFTDKAEPKKKYAIDFWFKPEGDKLALMDIRVQKGPKPEGESWVMITRLPVAWWWLPTSEHPGDMEVTRHWHIMGAIHKHIAETRVNGVYSLKDDKTGEIIPLEFVEMHQPIRRLKEDGRFFACTDFRKVGSKDEFYDVDFWLDQKSGEIKVGNVRVHKVPIQEDGVWMQEKRYDFKDLQFDEVK